ncbi:MAG: hypothetical protein MI861_06550, partial [Pirellulales bacterium]|nr:hypothetical protein [Pirellulales bacterium]
PAAESGADQGLSEVRNRDRPAASDMRSTRFATTTRKPAGAPVLELVRPDPQGRTGSVACSTCHSVRDPDYSNRAPSDLKQFHQDMPLAHGTIACYSCHNPDDADTLRLADTTVVPYPEVMTLCAQCHGPQAKDYAHGVHGGMTGYWDTSRGPRSRNNCIDCHDPHVPAFPKMRPSFKAHDRFLEPVAAHVGDSGQAVTAIDGADSGVESE